jgi:hypothetical protein
MFCDSWCYGIGLYCCPGNSGIQTGSISAVDLNINTINP